MSIEMDRRNRLASERGIVKPHKLAHVVRRTARLGELRQWYYTVLSAEVVHSDGMLAFPNYEDEHQRIAITAMPGLEEQRTMAAGLSKGERRQLVAWLRRVGAAARNGT